MILIINAGSSNVKYAIYDAVNLTLIYKAQADKINEVFSWLEANKNQYNIAAIGHRIVHGGAEFFAPALLNKSIVEQLKKLIPLAPLHLPNNIAAVEYIMREYPNIKQVACFDTAFHTTQFKLAKMFAIPNNAVTKGVERYGFHGLSYEYIASVMDEKLGIGPDKKVIVAHLGNGASMCAMQNGKSVATSMGFSALDGLMMGTRCGRIDPGVLVYLLQEKSYSVDQVADFLYNKSGLLGVSNLSNDMQELLASNDASAQTAIDLFCYKAAIEFGSLIVSLQGCDALIFTAGIGEHAPLIREKICAWLKWLGLVLDDVQNKQNNVIISAKTSNLLVAVIPTNEEYIIAKHTNRF